MSKTISSLAKLVKHQIVRTMKDNALVRRDFDGNVVDADRFLTASEAKDCIRALVYKKKGAVGIEDIIVDEFGDVVPGVVDEPMPDDLQGMSPEGYFIRGKTIEQVFVQHLVEATVDIPHIRILLTGEDQITLLDPDVYLAGTPDGIILDSNDKMLYVLEIKSVGHPIAQPLPGHIDQLAINMGLVKHNFVTDGYSIEGRLIYVNASNWTEIIEFPLVFELAQPIYEKHAARSMFVTHESMDAIPYEGAERKQCPRCHMKTVCMAAFDVSMSKGHQVAQKYSEAVEKARGAQRGFAPFRDFSDPTIRDAAKAATETYITNQRLLQDLKVANEELKDDALAWLEYSEGRWRTDEGLAQMIVIEDRKNVDTARMKADGIYDKYVKTSSYCGIRVNKIKGN